MILEVNPEFCVGDAAPLGDPCDASVGRSGGVAVDLAARAAADEIAVASLSGSSSRAVKELGAGRRPDTAWC